MGAWRRSNFTTMVLGTIDELRTWTPSLEVIRKKNTLLINIVPERGHGSGHPFPVITIHGKTFPYRYFDQDASGSNATFESGQMLQTLEGVRITGTEHHHWLMMSVFWDHVRSPTTKVFTGGDPTRGIRIQRDPTSGYGTIRLVKSMAASVWHDCALHDIRSAVAVNQRLSNSTSPGFRGSEWWGRSRYIIETKKQETNGVFSYLTTVSGPLSTATLWLQLLSTLYTYRAKNGRTNHRAQLKVLNGIYCHHTGLVLVLDCGSLYISQLDIQEVGLTME